MHSVYYQTPVGVAEVTEEDGFITSIHISDEEHEINATDNELLLNAITQLDEYFAGKRLQFDLPFKQKGTDFQQRVWQYLERIPYGTTTSYAKLADQMEQPLAIRAIASANGKNNLWIAVPCHRVIGSDGSLTGYAGGLWRKQWLLQHEARTIGIGQTMLNL
ncbi:methylated-DNA--[protein]-cysteine S-methyltransferase [Mucilaginibacter auburnensis]|uniref:Methylated-DNA--protein-cysteine methyltransferase n=1 Tax=Mucilaginibacter auburnensis TaxID=1457233 RepID=A0A2H9VM85_9SPHI|nr:methylated-DNA--[protein]-cysteine S-methyltransferase [Mucilaginibacter auburnensis]PJJ79423.1 methylated-DNA-[protein]-cysteine S-methyltransferase [Mucilaginibacter auburnensis]